MSARLLVFLLVVAGCPPDMDRPRPILDAARAERSPDARADRSLEARADRQSEARLPQKPVVLASAQPCPASLALDATHVYWANTDYFGKGNDPPELGGIFRLKKTLPATPELMQKNQHNVDQLAIDETRLCWAEAWNVANAAGVYCQAKQPLASRQTIAAPLEYPTLALDATAIYWSDMQGKTIQTRPAAGTTTTLASGQAGVQLLVSDGTLLAWIAEPSTTVQQIWTLDLHAVPPAPTKRFEGPAGVWDLALDGDHLYWATTGDKGSGNGSLQRISRTTWKVEPLQSGLERPTRLALDDDHLYWTSRTGLLFKVRKTAPAATPIPIAQSDAEAFAIAVDGTHVYFTTYPEPCSAHGGTVNRIAKE